MPNDYADTKESNDASNASEPSAGLTSEGIRSMQGSEPTAPPKEGAPAAKGTETADLSLDESQQIPLDQLESPYDRSTLEYRKGSPHADYDAYKGLVEGERQHQVSQQAATSESLGDAIDTTIAARREAKDSGETQMDQYRREKYGPAPYTEPAYEEDEGE